jgi:hypothetical protein
MSVFVLVMSAAARPAVAGPPEDGAASEAPAIDPEVAREVQELANQGSAKFEIADYEGAIELWEQAHDRLPPTVEYASMRAQLQVLLAHAHVQAYAVDEDPQHLHKADKLFAAFLEALDPADTVDRAQIESEREELAAELARLDAIRAEREEAEARELAAREAEARALALGELEVEDAPPWTEDDRRRTKVYTGVGASLVALGGVSLGLMAVGLVGGATTEQAGQDSIDSLPGDPADYTADTWADELRRGRTYNALAWTGGALAVALLSSGTALIAIAATQRRRAGVRGRARARPTGLELRF